MLMICVISYRDTVPKTYRMSIWTFYNEKEHVLKKKFHPVSFFRAFIIIFWQHFTRPGIQTHP